MLRPQQLLCLGAMVLCSARPTTAQPVGDPNFVEFTASADHNLLDPNGQPLVTGYDLRLYAVGSPAPLRFASLGKPTPDAGGRIRLALNTLLNPLPPGGVTYEVRIAAVGAGGSAESAPSNSFTFQVACTFSVSPASRSLGASSSSSTFTVTAPAGCGWTATESASWITITGGASGTGNGTVSFSVANNPTAAVRTASLAVAGQSRTVSQSGVPCTYAVSPASQSVARAGGSASFAVTAPAGCTWSASEQSSWINIASGASGNGAGTVTIIVGTHTGAQARSASAMIAGHGVMLSQPMPTTPTAPTGMHIVR